MHKGRIEAIVGGMFSGKSDELIRRIRRFLIIRTAVQVFKPEIDNRYATDAVVSHNKDTLECITVKNASEILDRVNKNVRVVAIDEAQFFGDDLLYVVETLANVSNLHIIVAGLDMDSEGKPFGPMPNLMAVADDVEKLHAVCIQCGDDATMSYHKGSKYALFEVGTAQYEARCRQCWAKGRNQPEAAPEAGAHSIREWQDIIHTYAKDKGWWQADKPRSFGDLCALFHSELSEAYEEYRNGHGLTEVYENPDKPGKLEGVPVELADCVIRILDFCGHAGIDLQAIMAKKHAYNQTREYRHGGKVT